MQASTLTQHQQVGNFLPGKKPPCNSCYSSGLVAAFDIDSDGLEFRDRQYQSVTGVGQIEIQTAGILCRIERWLAVAILYEAPLCGSKLLEVLTEYAAHQKSAQQQLFSVPVEIETLETKPFLIR